MGILFRSARSSGTTSSMPLFLIKVPTICVLFRSTISITFPEELGPTLRGKTRTFTISPPKAPLMSSEEINTSGPSSTSRNPNPLIVTDRTPSTDFPSLFEALRVLPLLPVSTGLPILEEYRDFPYLRILSVSLISVRIRLNFR